MKKPLIAGGVVLLLLFIAFFVFNPLWQSQPNTSPKVVSVQPRAIASGESTLMTADSAASTALQAPLHSDPSLISGVVEPYLDVTLGLVVQGKIGAIAVPEGRRVGQGGVILSLDKQQEELEVARRKIIYENKAELKSAESTAATLTETYNSNKNLYTETRSVSREELDKLSIQYENAIAERDKLRNQKQREKVEYDMALQTLESRLLKAPFSGVVEKVFLKVGEVYQPGQPLVRLIDASRCIFVANLDDTKSYHLKQGMSVEVLVNAGGTEVVRKGVITKIPTVVDAASGVMQVKVMFDNRDGSIRPGVTGKLRLPSDK